MQHQELLRQDAVSQCHTDAATSNPVTTAIIVGTQSFQKEEPAVVAIAMRSSANSAQASHDK